MQTFDAIVIGAGEAGSQIASRAVQSGKRVAMIYREPYGSTCLNAGCVPSKFLIHRARIAHLVRRAGRYHVDARLTGIRLADMVREKDAIVDSHRRSSFEAAQNAAGLTLLQGPARFLSAEVIAVGAERLNARQIFIASGLRPNIPDGFDSSSPRVLTSETIMQLTDLPARLVVIGGGYVACEFAQAYRRFGSSVTMIQRADHLLPNEEPDVSTILEQAFADEGVHVLLGHRAGQLDVGEDAVRVLAKGRDGVERWVEGSHLLLAAGRRPNTDMLSLDAAGVVTNAKGYVKVNDRLETGVRGIWAIGDVNGEQPFTRVCQEEARVAYANAFEGARLTVKRTALPHAVFTDPEVGVVGLTESAARERGLSVAVGIVTLDRVEKAQLLGETAGLIKYVVERKSRRILGCHVIGPNAAELVYDAVLVMHRDGILDEIGSAIGVFPTLQEGMEGTAKGLMRKLDSDELRGPLVRGKSQPAAMEVR
ncbi:MAG: dihydrolipoyl dehydrogenase family protein [Gemmatimonadaceae bacterium]